MIEGGLSSLDEYLMLQAFQVAMESDDPKAAQYPDSGVGAVIIKDDFIVSRSANKVVPRMVSKVTLDDPNSPERYYFIEHAERCAIFAALNAGIDLDRATLYCTRFPCVDCARAISLANITRLVVPTGFANETKWKDAQRAALSVLRRSDVTIRYFDPRTKR